MWGALEAMALEVVAYMLVCNQVWRGADARVAACCTLTEARGDEAVVALPSRAGDVLMARGVGPHEVTEGSLARPRGRWRAGGAGRDVSYAPLPAELVFGGYELFPPAAAGETGFAPRRSTQPPFAAHLVKNAGGHGDPAAAAGSVVAEAGVAGSGQARGSEAAASGASPPLGDSVPRGWRTAR